MPVMAVESSNFVIPEDRDEDQVQSPLGNDQSKTNILNDSKKGSLIGAKLNTESEKNISASSSIAAAQAQPQKISSSENEVTDKNVSGEVVPEDDDYEEDDYEEDDNNYEDDDAFEEEDDSGEQSVAQNPTQKALGKSVGLINEEGPRKHLINSNTAKTSNETLQGVRFGQTKLNQESTSIVNPSSSSISQQ